MVITIVLLWPVPVPFNARSPIEQYSGIPGILSQLYGLVLNDGLSDGLSDGVNRIINDGVNDGVSDGISDGVKNEIVSIIQLLARNEGLNADNIVEKLGNKSKPTIERYLKTARILDMVVYKGSAKTGGYFLTDKMIKYKNELKFK